MPTPAEVAKRFTEKVFSARGNNSEIHLKRPELESMLELAIELALELKVTMPVILIQDSDITGAKVKL